jgi:uncharacterized membrane protein YhaH (DUF805 family)
MNFSEAMNAGFKQGLRVQGRARRSEYWYFSLYAWLLAALLALECLVEKSIFNGGTGYIHRLLAQIELNQITNPLSTIPSALGLVGLFAVLGLFCLGTAASLAVSVVPLITLQVRRLHDTGRSGWWVVNAKLAFALGTVILVIGTRTGYPTFEIATLLLAIGFFTVPLALVFLLAQPGVADSNKYDEDRSRVRRTRQPPSFKNSSQPSAVTPAR